MPTKGEIDQFLDRLTEHGLKSFDDLSSLQKPKVLQKLENSEKFIIEIIKNIEVIEKAKLLMTLIKIDDILDEADKEMDSWFQIHEYLTADCEDFENEIGMTSTFLFQKILSVGLYSSQLMSTTCKKAQAFDIMKALQADGDFFNKKTLGNKTKERKDMYEVLVKMVAKQLISDGFVG